MSGIIKEPLGLLVRCLVVSYKSIVENVLRQIRYTVMNHLPVGLCSKNCIIRQFDCVNCLEYHKHYDTMVGVFCSKCIQ